MIFVNVRQRDACAQATEPITAGSVGLELCFGFSEDWRELGKTAVFRGSGLQVDAALMTDRCQVPHEVLTRAGGHLKIGVYGSGENGQRVTPTVWADAGEILEGAQPSGIEETPATESLVQQLLAAAQQAREIAQSVRDDADAGEFDGAPGPQGPKGATGPQGPKGDPGEVSQAEFDGLSGEVGDVKSAIHRIDRDLCKSINVNLGIFPSENTVLSGTTGKWYNGNAYSSVFIPISADVSSIVLQANASRRTRYALLTTNAYTNGTIPSYADGRGMMELDPGETITLNVPADAKYLYILKISEGLDYSPSIIKFNYNENSIFTEITLPFEFGGINAWSGVLVENNIRLRNRLGLPGFVDKIIADEGYSFVVIGCTFSDSHYLGSWTGVSWTGSGPAAQLQYLDMSEINALADYFLIMIRKVSGEELSVSDASHVHFLCRNVSKFAGLKYAALGDSITYGYVPRNTFGYPGQLKSYADLTAMRLGMTFENFGISGSTLAYHQTRDPMSRRFNSLPDDADIITVMGGTNDIRNGIQLGTMADRTDATYYGALHVVLGGLYKKYMIDQGTSTGRKKRIVALTPIKLLAESAAESGGTGTLVDFEPWINAVKEVAAYYSIPCLDFYHLSGINPHVNETVKGTVTGYTGYYNPYITDGTHPTREGAEIMAEVLCGFLETLK